MNRREDRKARGLTLAQEARRLGISVSDVLDLDCQEVGSEITPPAIALITQATADDVLRTMLNTKPKPTEGRRSPKRPLTKEQAERRDASVALRAKVKRICASMESYERNRQAKINAFAAMLDRQYEADEREMSKLLDQIDSEEPANETIKETN